MKISIRRCDSMNRLACSGHSRTQLLMPTPLLLGRTLLVLLLLSLGLAARSAEAGFFDEPPVAVGEYFNDDYWMYTNPVFGEDGTLWVATVMTGGYIHLLNFNKNI